MRRVDGKLVWSPSDLVTYLKSPYASWMDRLRIERPGAAEPDAETAGERLIADKGTEHEKQWLDGIRKNGREVAEILQKEGRPDYEATRKAIAEGREVIYQAALERDGFAGYADFLERVPEEEGRLKPTWGSPASAKRGLGVGAVQAGGVKPAVQAGHHYEIVDTKLARSPKPYFILQLCAYAEMLEAAQGRMPDKIHVVLGTGDRKTYRTEDYLYAYRSVKRRFLAAMAEFDPENRPAPDPGDDHGRWKSWVDEWVREHDHLSRVANISRSQIRKLEEAGVPTMAALAILEERRIPKLGDAQRDKLRAQARLQRASETAASPAYEVLRPETDDPRRGLAMLPPPSAGDVWIDFEGFPLLEGGLEYLFGATTADGGGVQYHDWWAHDQQEEKRAFEGFIDFLYARWRRHPDLHLFHYAAYEITALRRLMGRYATREIEVDALLRAEVFVDLLVVVRQGVRIGTESYSLKAIERLWRKKREGEVASGAASIVAYHLFRESGEPRDWKQSPKLQQIRDYNRDDCESTRDLTEWLRARQTEAKIAWIEPRRDPESADPETASKLRAEDQEAASLAAEMLAEIPADREVRKRDEDRWRVQEILAQLLCFHRREQKPMWWELYERRDKTHVELAEDEGCLGNLRLEPGPAESIKKSKGWWYGFDRQQETKLRDGEACYFSHDLTVKATIETLDRKAGRVLVKLGPTAVAGLEGGNPPALLSLVPDEFFDQTTLKKSILEVAKEWRASGRVPRRLEDVLLRHPARVSGLTGGPILRPGEDATEGAVRIARDLDRTTLCIQGPPGTGKTYTGAKMILDLVARGKRVGITATGHVAIVNLMKRCCEFPEGENLACLKVGGPEPTDLLAASPNAAHEKSSEKAAQATAFKVVGGTPWFFARPDVAAQFDYLFVDEAGQFSLANLVAVARSCTNFVLLGDQLQLGQPIKGAHPGESGRSALDYLLHGQATIRPEFGIFLEQTFRLHPKVCSFISGAIYENRLQPKPSNVNRVVRVPKSGARLVTIDAGLLFIPVDHDGCRQASDDEVDVIRQLFGELVGRERVSSEKKDTGPLGVSDILVVAPYNMQVRRLESILPAGARIGSVDKFQGQQAPIVIVSMCASDGDGSARGIDFLFNKNRLNVAVSRAQSLAIVVGSPALARSRCSSVEQMALVNTFCRIVEEGSGTV